MEGAFSASIGSVPVVLTAVPRVVVEYGMEARLECNATGSPLPFISWHRFLNGTVGAEVLAESKDYTLPFARKEDAGEYACKAANDEGTTVGRVTLDVLGT